ncbi:MAG: hypothetical protein HYY52_03530 [Candidatus Melainabacteria bacterium]|nr:hypothetical protein [Candidatus Melainabacteria bacterium]
MRLKSSNSTFDYIELVQKSDGLSDEEIFNAIKDHTPEILTQENIIAAFEQVRKLAS